MLGGSSNVSFPVTKIQTRRDKRFVSNKGPQVLLEKGLTSLVSVGSDPENLGRNLCPITRRAPLVTPVV